MGYSRYRLNRVFKKLTLVAFLGTCAVLLLSLLDISVLQMFVLRSPFHSDISKFTALYSSTLAPRCANFSEYNLDAKSYWQYYGFQHHMKLTPKSLSTILNVDDAQQDEITRLHTSLLGEYLTPRFGPFANLQKAATRSNTKDNKGIVYVSGKGYYWLTILSIKYIRDVLKDKTPVEIFVPFRDKHDNHCNKISLVYPNVKCSFFSDYLSYGQLYNLSGYQYKSLAMLLTSFNEILYLDSDNIPISSVADMFNNPNYLKTGFISWADFWKRSTNYNFYSMAGLTRFANPISSTPSVEAGQILINKEHHIRTLLLAYYYNYYGPQYFYPLFSQGFPGEGDKETFYLASRVTGDNSYLITGHTTKSFGYKDKQGAYVGQGILQTDPSNFSKYWFLHINYPKLDIVSMFKKGFFKGDKLERKWTFIRNAQEDGKSVPFRQTLGQDFEYDVWKIMTSILDTDFNGFRLFEEIGNDELSDFVKAHLVRLEHSKLETR